MYREERNKQIEHCQHQAVLEYLMLAADVGMGWGIDCFLLWELWFIFFFQDSQFTLASECTIAHKSEIRLLL